MGRRVGLVDFPSSVSLWPTSFLTAYNSTCAVQNENTVYPYPATRRSQSRVVVEAGGSSLSSQKEEVFCL